MNKQDQIRQNIRDLREDKKLSQAKMAQLIPMSLTGYSKLERGENKISIDRLARIAQILEVDMTDLMANESDGVIVINNSSDILNNSPFSLAMGDPALEAEILRLKAAMDMKDEVINSRDREIHLLKDQIDTLKQLAESLKG